MYLSFLVVVVCGSADANQDYDSQDNVNYTNATTVSSSLVGFYGVRWQRRRSPLSSCRSSLGHHFMQRCCCRILIHYSYESVSTPDARHSVGRYDPALCVVHAGPRVHFTTFFCADVCLGVRSETQVALLELGDEPTTHPVPSKNFLANFNLSGLALPSHPLDPAFGGLYRCNEGYGSIRTENRTVVCGANGFYGKYSKRILPLRCPPCRLFVANCDCLRCRFVESVAGDALCFAMECELAANDEPVRGFDLDIE